PVVLGDLAGHAHGVADRDLAGSVRGVDEQGGGAAVAAEVQGAAGAGGLDDVAVQAAGRVHSGDHALGGERVAGQRRLVAGALNVGDRGLGRVRRRLLIVAAAAVAVVTAVARIGARRGECGLALDEVGGVLAGRGDAGDGGDVVRPGRG